MAAPGVSSDVTTGDARPMDWYEQARVTERIQDRDTAIALVSARAECYSRGANMRNNHLWHVDLPARAERIPELMERARTDVHARRRLNRSPQERGGKAVLRDRAEDGDRGPCTPLSDGHRPTGNSDA